MNYKKKKLAKSIGIRGDKTIQNSLNKLNNINSVILKKLMKNKKFQCKK